MRDRYVVHGGAGTGSVAVEAALTLMGLPYEVIETAALAGRPRDDALARVNPMRQVPALILPSGELMTESAAILIWLADDHPEARLSPTMAAATRPAFLRWMAFVASAIYALCWIRDDPSRVTADADEAARVKARLGARISHCWAVMDAGVDPGRYILGEELSVLDLYVTVISRWAERRRRFYEVAPKLARVVRRVDAEPRLADLWARRFPFVDGWEG
ncbi:MAG TPA: glutathione S-transferase family protein [Caulobacteraceae bacterium]|nr:glutathione S-transferase family protein [Caulobacteraceae bacterium]